MPKKRLVSSGPIGASESDHGWTTIDQRVRDEDADERQPEPRPGRRTSRPEEPPATVHAPTSATRDPAAPAG